LHPLGLAIDLREQPGLFLSCAVLRRSLSLALIADQLRLPQKLAPSLTWMSPLSRLWSQQQNLCSCARHVSPLHLHVKVPWMLWRLALAKPLELAKTPRLKHWRQARIPQALRE
jgi:hypothetical protein